MSAPDHQHHAPINAPQQQQHPGQYGGGPPPASVPYDSQFGAPPQQYQQQQQYMQQQQQPYMQQQQPYVQQQQPQMQQPYMQQQQQYGGGPPPPPGAVIMQQPQHMPPPGGATPAGCPPGLEYLSLLDQVLVKQQVELLEAMTGFETQNKYRVVNTMGQQMYMAKEESGCLTRQCCGPVRPFEMEIADNFGNDVIHLNRHLRCDSCCCPCCLQKMDVSSPPGTIIGSIEQDWSIIFPKFSIKDSHGHTVLHIKGPFCTCSCFGSDVEFVVSTPDGNEIGKISKQWTGLLREGWTDADNFGVSFPKDLDVKVKATLLGAVFLIDFMFFEKSGNQRNDGPGMMN